MLEIDAGKRCGQRAQIGSGCTDQAGELAKGPVGGRDGHILARHE